MSDRTGPIFIGGLSHSGKTQVRIVLGAHPHLSMTRGTALWDRYFGRFGDLEVAANLERCLVAIGRDPAVAALRPDPERVRRELRRGPVTYARVFGLVHRHHAERLGKRRWGDQLRGVERFADQIFETFPNARMIHMVRDPRAEVVDASRRWWLGAVGWSTARWITSTDLAERNARRYGDRYRVVRYESLAATPTATMRELCAFLGEELLPTMEDALASIRFEPPVGAPSSEATGSARAFVDRYATRDLRRLDYPVETPGTAVGRAGALTIVHRAVDRASMAAWRLLDGRSILRRARG